MQRPIPRANRSWLARIATDTNIVPLFLPSADTRPSALRMTNRDRATLVTIEPCPSRSSTSKGHPRERIEAAVVAGGKHTEGPHEAWIAADSFKSGCRVLITGSHGFERTVTFAIDDDSAVIAERVRETLDE
jgi:hypothetical protein